MPGGFGRVSFCSDWLSVESDVQSSKRDLSFVFALSLLCQVKEAITLWVPVKDLKLAQA